MELTAENWVSLILLVLAISVGDIVYVRRKVQRYFVSKFPASSGLSVRWTILGPFAPGDRNHKYRVSFLDADRRRHEYLAVGSTFGSVFIREAE